MTITVDGLTDEEVLILGQRVRRPQRVHYLDWRRFWTGHGDARRLLEIDRWDCRVFGTVILRPHHVLVPDWFEFWGRRCNVNQKMERHA